MQIQPERIVVESQELPHTAAAWIATAIDQAIRDTGQCSIALSGGKSPQPIYAELADAFREIPWTKVHVYFGDERAVPPTDPMSNYGMAKASLLDRVSLPAANVHRMEGERADLAAAAGEYDRLLPPAVDVLLLGIGPDGHTASLFPGAPALDERARRVVAADSPFPPPRRLTITPPVIAAARRIAMIVAARDKAGIVQRALEGPRDPHALPSQLALGGVWILDRDAASKLTPVPA
ncbi:MAG TPA: 6-phosphogluconolactonase [Gemmatimonadaceae bacterium]|nr:6-phosphogluconolactonase [Gemmatimonadaceae bacterium]